MNSENTKEYELIREEMITVKECITKYVGFVLGGSGVAIYAILSFLHSSSKYLEIPFTCFTLSIIINFVLLILFYKFYSHNRFAGYCKMLDHESYSPPGSAGSDSLFAWEICVERLRASASNPKVLLALIDGLKVAKLNKSDLIFLLGRYTGRNAPVDRGDFNKGLKILVSAILGKIVTKSWSFPPIIVAMFFFIIFGFLAGGFFTIIDISFAGNSNDTYRWTVYILVGIIVLAHLISWWRYLGKLFSLMNGSATVDAFFWGFLPVRVLFLNDRNVTPEYFYANELLKEAIEELQ